MPLHWPIYNAFKIDKTVRIKNSIAFKNEMSNKIYSILKGVLKWLYFQGERYTEIESVQLDTMSEIEAPSDSVIGTPLKDVSNQKHYFLIGEAEMAMIG